MQSQSQPQIKGFPYNSLQWDGSLFCNTCQEPISLEWESNEIGTCLQSQNKSISKQDMEGEWKFKGYFPKDCKPMPKCHMDKLNFKINETPDYNGLYWRFKADGNKVGEECSYKEREQNTLGKVWTRNHFMMFNNHDDPKQWSKRLETPFIFDKHPTTNRLFIKDQNVDDCWIVYNKMNQDEFNEKEMKLADAQDSKKKSKTWVPKNKKPKKKQLKIRDECIHIGGKFKDTPTGRKEPRCRNCPDNPLNKGYVPGTMIDL